MRWYLMLWAASAALYFYVYTRKWMASLEYRNRLGWLVLLLSCLGMVFSVLLPYAPYVHATLSKWHTRLAMGSTILYVLLIFHIPVSYTHLVEQHKPAVFANGMPSSMPPCDRRQSETYREYRYIS